MKNSNLLLGIIVIALVFGMTVVRCDNGSTNQEKETWSNITTLDQMHGTWKAAYSQNNKLFKDVIVEQGGTWDSTMQNIYGNLKFTSRAEITLIINASAKTQAMSMTSTATYSGGNIKTLWPVFRASLEGTLEEEGIGVTFDDTTHSVSVAYVYPEETMSEEAITDMLNFGLGINLDGTKIKMPENSLIQGLAELIFIKQ
jgi:hypothetical protein